MDWIIYAVIVLVASAASYYSAQRASRGPELKEGEFDAPTAAEGAKIPKLFGTRKISSANVVWYGDVSTEPVKK